MPVLTTVKLKCLPVLTILIYSNDHQKIYLVLELQKLRMLSSNNEKNKNSNYLFNLIIKRRLHASQVSNLDTSQIWKKTCIETESSIFSLLLLPAASIFIASAACDRYQADLRFRGPVLTNCLDFMTEISFNWRSPNGANQGI